MSLKPWWEYPSQNDPKYDTVLPPKNGLETITAEQSLDEDHLAAYSRAITNVLSTDLAESTFAQLVDGLPLWDVVYGLAYYGLVREEPVYNHRILCAGVLEKTRAFYKSFIPGQLQIRDDALRRYQSVPVDSRVSKLVLIELVAVAVHTIAAYLFKDNSGLHQDEVYPSDEFYKEADFRRKKPTPFSLWRYDNPDQYPDGVADVAGYWAEDQIFGGIVLFDRGESGTENKSLWFHSSRRGSTEHIYALNDEQTASLLRFLESGPSGAAPCPFPIQEHPDSVRRDYEISMQKYNIYRDRWERKSRYRSYWWYNIYQSKCTAFGEDPKKHPEWGHEGEP